MGLEGEVSFLDGSIIFFFGFPDLSLTTQTRFSNLTILLHVSGLASKSIHLNFGVTWGRPGCNLLF